MARTDPRPHYGTKRRPRDDGYVDVWVPGHPMARQDGYAMEHRVMAWDAGLLTDPSYEVHHMDHVRDHNELSNFEIKTGSDHAREHAEERGCVTNQFGTFAVKPAEERQSALYGEVRLSRPTEPCLGCGGPIDPSLRRDAKYCSGNCRVRHWKREHRK